MKSPDQILEQTKRAILDRQRFLHLRGDFHLTKTEPNFSDVLLERDFDLEHNTFQYLEKKSGTSTLIERYRKYDPDLELKNLPPHYAMRVLSGAGSICSGANIFMFFPLVLGISPQNRGDAFGFEFIDIWKNIFQTSIFPCVREVFSLESQINIYRRLNGDLERTIFLAAVFHELGHEVGPWRVSPKPRSDMHLSGYELDVLGELSTDSLMILNLHEYAEIPLFIILQRLFWFARRGYKENPLQGQLNQDNDSWIGIYLWNKLKKHQVLSISGRKLNYDSGSVNACFMEIISEIDALFISNEDPEVQKSVIQNWQKSSVSSRNENGKFIYPEDLQHFLSRCQGITEVPQFFPAFSYHQLNDLKEMCS